MENKLNILKALLLVNITITAYIIKINDNLQKNLESIRLNISELEKNQKEISSKVDSTTLDLTNIVNTKIDENTVHMFQTETISTLLLGVTLLAAVTFFFYLNHSYIEATHITTISSMEKCCNTELQAINIANQNTINLMEMGSKKLDLISSIHETQLSNVESNIIDVLNQKIPESVDTLSQAVTTIASST